MNFTCSQCFQPIEIDDSELVGLSGEAVIPCPTCGSQVPVTGWVEEPAPPQASTGAPPTAQVPASSAASRQAAMLIFQKANRNMIMLGAAALLVLGGLAGYLVFQFSGNRVELNQDITNQILKNKFFTDLIASGATTMQQLRKVARIEMQGPGFIGLSREEMTWEQALEFAYSTGSKMLAVESPSENKAPWIDPTMQRLVKFLEHRFPAAQGSTVWVIQNSDVKQPRVFHAPDVSLVSTGERPRRVFLDWRIPPKAPDKGANISALRFDGKQAVVVEDHPDFHEIEKNDELSIEAWIRVHRLDRRIFPIVDKSNRTNGYGWYFELSGDTITFIGGQGPGAQTKWQAPLWGWSHVALSYRRSEGRARFYANGKLAGEMAYNADVQPTTPTPLYIGQGISGVNEHTFGDIDEVRLWKRALSADELAQGFQRQLKGDEQGLVGCWSFDEGSGTDTKDLTGHHKTSLFPQAAPPVWETTVPYLAPNP